MKREGSDGILACVHEFESEFRLGGDLSHSDLSVVVVTYDRNQDLKLVLDALNRQVSRNFEVIIVNNGSDDEPLNFFQNLKFNLKYLRLNKNYGPSIARNIGIENSNGRIICFLDDDGLPNEEWTKMQSEAYDNYEIVGLRGKILPKRKYSIFNELVGHYDLGSHVRPAFVEVEGNCSFKREILIDVGGFKSGLFGYEGLELSYRIFNILRDQNMLIYHPEVIIYHDYGYDLLGYLKKKVRHKKMYCYLKHVCPGIDRFRRSYEEFVVELPKGSFGFFKSSLIWIIGRLGNIAGRLGELAYLVERRGGLP